MQVKVSKKTGIERFPSLAKESPLVPHGRVPPFMLAPYSATRSQHGSMPIGCTLLDETDRLYDCFPSFSNSLCLAFCLNDTFYVTSTFALTREKSTMYLTMCTQAPVLGAWRYALAAQPCCLLPDGQVASHC